MLHKIPQQWKQRNPALSVKGQRIVQGYQDEQEIFKRTGFFFLSTVLKRFMHKHEDRWYFCLEKLPLISDIGLIFSEEQLISVNDRADVRVSFPPSSCPAQQRCCNQEIKCAYSCVKCRPEPCLTLEPGCSLFLISSQCLTTEMDSITPHFLYCTRRKH